MRCLNAECRKKFEPTTPNQRVCSFVCSIAAIRQQNTIKKYIKEEKKIQKKIDKAKKIDIMSVDAYRSKVIQPLVNKVARLIDYGLPCIATGKHGKINGGHYISVGANRSVCLNLHNIHRQSFESNHFKSGDNVKYMEGIIREYGQDYADLVKGLHRIKRKFQKVELMVMKDTLKDIIKELEAENKTLKEPRSPEQRISLRTYYNMQLGYYEN
jgi:Bacteriophage Lambda NinG protein